MGAQNGRWVPKMGDGCPKWEIRISPPLLQMYWEDISAPACKIQLNVGLIAHLLERFLGSEPRFAHVRRVTKVIERHITWCLGHGQSLPPLKTLVANFWAREEEPSPVESTESMV